MSRATLFLAKVGLFFASVVILFSAVEIGAFFVRRAVSFAPRPETRDMSASSVYQGQPWAEQFWREENIAFNREKYWPFVVWKMAPFTGSTIVINGDGVRRTFHSHCGDPTAYTIWMFGGSTMLGQGVPDWFTIPSLVAELYEKAGRPACVVNEGELGWANTQEVIELMLKLKRAKRKPNLVIFYDGANDSAIAQGRDPVDTHLDFERIQRKVERDDQRQPGSFRYLLESNTARLIIGLGQRMAERRGATKPAAEPPDDVTWKRRLDIAYFKNQGIVAEMAQVDGFTYAFFWQPIVYGGNKPLTEEEHEIATQQQARYNASGVVTRIYDFAGRQSQSQFFDIADVFSGVRATVYIDPWHLGPQGNQLVAERMFAVLRAQGYQ